MRKNKKDYRMLIIILLLTAIIMTFLCVINWSYGGRISKQCVPESIVMSTVEVEPIAAHNDERSEEQETTIEIPTTTQIIKKQKKKYKTAYIKANDLNLRKKPKIKSKSITRLFYGKRIKFIKVNKKWSKIKVDKKVGYVQTKYITTKKLKSRTHTSIPHYKLCSFMDYRCITNTSSKQHKLQRKAYTGNYGIRQVEGRYCIAVGSYYTEKVGTYIDLELKNGTVIPCILADCKADRDTDGMNQKTADGSLIEFVVDTPQLSRKVRQRGDVAYATKKWNSKIVKIKIHKNK
ncbi:SH3 domain-containing protein [uncultured Eubacterium sp.]|uniref:SH3 domain-containing protein n=1 Tax=uncultured Eubacterium sp. TaxID=165185 RepID=UPI002592FD29|nr:SH3 domain-containing protein [uncultured Eubacterium sp.]